MSWTHIAEAIATASGKPFHLQRADSMGGGCINTAYRLVGERQSYFIKLNRAERLDMFEAESDGLQALAAARAIRVPVPLCTGVEGSQAYLVMEYFESGGGNSGAAEDFGQQLARMHQQSTEQFGWHRDNTIGSTPQPNTPRDDWLEFWRDRRLGYQLGLAEQRGGPSSLLRKGEQLMQLMPGLFTDYQPSPSLLHGDLWSGNYAVTHEGEPIIFDPAVYYGDREADIAMTELFGGFSQRFYAAYDDTWPLDSGYQLRKTFYNLYHILNHFNMFGGGYAGQAERMTEQCLSELR
ncbi:MAG: fructosamine kinase family protein [Gammaproteobacteria bacterium]|nr:fructosamine kinase family protein [Gammaproteobacteria bacterium]